MPAAGQRAATMALICLTASALLWPAASRAGHAQDFLLTDSGYLTGADKLYLVSPFEARYRTRGRSGADWDPGVRYGLTEWLTLGLNSETGKRRGDDWRYDGTNAMAQVRLTPRPMRLALGTRFDYFHPRRSDEDGRWQVRNIASYKSDEWTYSAHIDYSRETRSDYEDLWSYALALKGQVSPRVAYGLELAGTIERSGTLKGLVGAYIDPDRDFSVHLGIGSGIVRGPGLTFRAELIARLR
jgi:hypothetical protein